MQASRFGSTAADVGSAKKECGYRLAEAGFSFRVYTARWVFLFVAHWQKPCNTSLLLESGSTIGKIAFALLSCGAPRLARFFHNAYDGGLAKRAYLIA